jgi:hypothetical protein
MMKQWTIFHRLADYLHSLTRAVLGKLQDNYIKCLLDSNRSIAAWLGAFGGVCAGPR